MDFEACAEEPGGSLVLDQRNYLNSSNRWEAAQTRCSVRVGVEVSLSGREDLNLAPAGPLAPPGAGIVAAFCLIVAITTPHASPGALDPLT